MTSRIWQEGAYLYGCVRYLLFGERLGHRPRESLNGIRVYDAQADWAEHARDADYDADSYGAAFAPDGRLATTSLDGNVRLYDRDFTLVTVVERAHERPFDLAFNPDGTRLAVGFIDSTGFFHAELFFAGG